MQTGEENSGSPNSGNPTSWDIKYKGENLRTMKETKQTDEWGGYTEIGKLYWWEVKVTEVPQKQRQDAKHQNTRRTWKVMPKIQQEIESQSSGINSLKGQIGDGPMKSGIDKMWPLNPSHPPPESSSLCVRAISLCLLTVQQVKLAME